MHRYIVAAVSGLALIASSLSAPAEVLFPKASAYFAVEPPPGWTATDNGTSLQVAAADQSAAIVLTLSHNAPLNGQPAQTVALSIGKGMGVTQFAKQEAGKRWNKDGQIFTAEMVSQNTPLEVQIVVIQAAADLLITQTIIASKTLTGPQERSLGQALGGIRLVNAP